MTVFSLFNRAGNLTTAEWSLQESFRELLSDLDRQQTFDMHKEDGSTVRLSGTGAEILKQALEITQKELDQGVIINRFHYESHGPGGGKPKVAQIIEELASTIPPNFDYASSKGRSLSDFYREAKAVESRMALPVKARTLKEAILNVIGLHDFYDKTFSVSRDDVLRCEGFQQVAQKLKQAGIEIDPKGTVREPWFMGNEFGLPIQYYDPSELGLRLKLAPT